MNNKGQALVEFVLLLPVFLIILLVVVDFGNLLYSKNKLENDSNDMVRIIKNDSDIDLDEDYPNIDVEIVNMDDGYKEIKFSTSIDINTPLLDKILGDPCLIETKRVVYYE